MSSSSKPPERPVFFIDRSLGKNVISQALRNAHCEVKVHDELFPQDAPDEEWLREVGRNGWIVLTKDKNIRFRELEKQALISSKARAFVLTARDVTGPEMAEIFVKALPKMLRILERTPGPFLARVTRGGQVDLLEIRSLNKTPGRKKGNTLS
ncbi:MAG TPA: hypothetical protein VNX66_07665 [Candidatus Sulfotelmatobacter sp.]|nr:hypothetical protein [Candidatus Sulfotelmatobacter sp.]